MYQTRLIQLYNTGFTACADALDPRPKFSLRELPSGVFTEDHESNTSAYFRVVSKVRRVGDAHKPDILASLDFQNNLEIRRGVTVTVLSQNPWHALMTSASAKYLDFFYPSPLSAFSRKPLTSLNILLNSVHFSTTLSPPGLRTSLMEVPLCCTHGVNKQSPKSGG